MKISLPKSEDFKTRKQWEESAWLELVMWCTKSDPKLVHTLLDSITSSSERRHIIKRAIAVDRIHHGASYRDIGEELWLTPQTISSIKKGLVSHTYKSNWERAEAQKKARDLAWVKKRHERPEPKFYKRTKYGKLQVRWGA
jgi:DNA-binding NarL/FixJ family response regulator